ncbi:hypothetical protein HDU87_002716 [Geranomyces variabilis]|uniref:Peptidase M20 dimerisation domain-containing protein n=1 Tax=Geranomyces variabilis TaxID=109894 RepID=A0AAD5XUW0_9FUNG|nr:hypothetical protein HDU87_002716 [Geranomyces variabilis]
MRPASPFCSAKSLPALAVIPLLVLTCSRLLHNAASIDSLQPPPLAPSYPFRTIADSVNRTQTEQRVAAAIRIPTVSKTTGALSAAAAAAAEANQHAQLRAFRAFLRAEFPAVFAVVDAEVVGDHSWLLRWKGIDEVGANAKARKPVLICGHMDVVDVDHVDQWRYPPFAGTVAGGFVHGRGALDMKGMLISELVAVEALIKAGYKPKRTFYMAFGHDEETQKTQGSAALSTLFEERGLRFEFVIDEGLVIANDMFPGFKTPIALIGVAEKGIAQLTIRATAPGGHASMPFVPSPVYTLATALTRLAKFGPPATLADGPVWDLLRTLAPEHPNPLVRAVLGNRFLAEYLIKWLPSHIIPGLAAMTRTTLATTVISGGLGMNILPTTATASVNCRVRPGETADMVLAYVAKAIGAEVVSAADQNAASAAATEGTGARTTDDTLLSTRLTIAWNNVCGPRGCDPSAVSSSTSDAYRILAGSIREVYGKAAALPGAPRNSVHDILVAPSLFIGATDATSYQGVADAVYRFQPIRLRPADLSLIHGRDERIATKDLHDMVNFFIVLILNADEGSP